MFMQNRIYVNTIAIASGKGGVGKTNVVVNLAVALNACARKVLILDADLGLSNVGLLLPQARQYGLHLLLGGDRTLKDICADGFPGIRVLATEQGAQDLTTLTESQRFKLLEAFSDCSGGLDALLIDTASGISENVAFFCSVAQQIVVVIDPDPMSLADAFALIRTLNTRYWETDFSVLVNSAKSSDEALHVFGEFSRVAEKELSVSLDYLGHIPFDKSVQNAVRSRRAFTELFPDCPASEAIRSIAQKFLDPADKVKGTLQFFLGNHLSSTRGARR